jgi:hypothetical protein
MYMGTNIMTYFYAFEVERLSKKLATFFLHYMDNLHAITVYPYIILTTEEFEPLR